MTVRQRLKTRATRLLASEGILAGRRGLHETRRRLMGGEHRVAFYHRVDDPHAHLLVQLLPALVEAYDVALAPRLVPPPTPEMAPEPELLAGFGVRDCAELARYYELEFDPAWRLPGAALVAEANAILAAALGSPRFLALAEAVGRALWAGDEGALAALAAEHGRTGDDEAARIVAQGGAELAKEGHYLAATLHYGGEWYWGIDRLGWLEERLGDLGLGPGADGESVLRRRPRFPADDLAGGDGEVRLEYYISFRSPYTYLSLERVLDLVARYPVRLEAKPVLPMLMRGLPVPRQKQLYIIGDAAREARRHGVPFGNLCDPLGPGVERCMAVFEHAVDRGRVIEYLRATFHGIWAEAIDAASDDGLARMVERAGLDWSEARARIADQSWREMAERNRRDLAAHGQWGVPSFALGPYAAWGQDRIWILEEKLKAYFGQGGAEP